MRDAPYPLAAHLGIVAARVGMHAYDKTNTLTLTPEEAIKIVQGIKLYQAHPHKRKPQKNEIVWREGGLTLSRPHITENNNYNKTQKNPLILIPSMINQSYILDLCPEKSILAWLNQNGVQAYLLDWGDLTGFSENTKIENVVNNHIKSAINFLHKKTGKHVDMLGYCMGGTLGTLAVMNKDIPVNRLILLAAPWDFRAENSPLSEHIRLWSNHVLPVIEKKGYLPSEWIQSLFATLNQEGAAKKFINFTQTPQESETAALFVMVEDWLNDGVDLPGAIALQCIREWFIENRLITGEFEMNGIRIQPEKISQKCLIVASKQDRIVSYESAINIRHSLSATHCDLITPETGHIGLIVGRKAIDDVWTPIVEWLSGTDRQKEK